MHVLCTRSIFLQHSRQDVWLLILYHVEMKNCLYTSSHCKTLEVTMCGLLSDRSDVITVWGLLRNRSERQATVHWKKKPQESAACVVSDF